MFYDREKPNTPKCQTGSTFYFIYFSFPSIFFFFFLFVHNCQKKGFIDFLVRPMFNKWNVFSQSDASVKCSLNLESNYIFWKGLLEQNVTEVSIFLFSFFSSKV